MSDFDIKTETPEQSNQFPHPNLRWMISGV